jgi:serine/threonine protein phosphatase PrpC
MGGHEAGEVASSLALETLQAALAASPEEAGVEESVSSAVAAANAEVRVRASGSGARGMGATLTVVLLRGDDAVIAEVGDSRAYLLRGGRLEQVTHDQSLVQYLVDKGALSPAEARTSSRRNILLQAVGRADEIQVAVGRLRVRAGDRFLLCCDGLSNAVSDEELCGLVAGDDLSESCRRMVDLANERGGTDNVTVVLAEVSGEGLLAPEPDETVAKSLQVLRSFAGPS